MRAGEKLKRSAVKWAVWAFGGYAMVAGVLTLVGWFAGLPRLVDWVGSGISMFPNTALAAVCASASLLFGTVDGRWSLRVSAGLGLFVALVGSATLFQHLSGIDLGIDRLLIEPPGKT